MKLLDWFLKRRNKDDEEFEDTFDEEFEERYEEKTIDRDDVDMDDVYQRQKYTQSCMEQIAEATRETERLEEEYKTINAHLKDIEEVEMLNGMDKDLLCEHAKGIKNLGRDTSIYEGKKDRMKDSDFKKMRRLESNAHEGIKKLREAEQYQEAIRQDLRRLESEKQANIYRQSEATIGLNNYRGMAVILACAVFICIALLLFLQFAMELDTTVGYVLIMLAAGIAFITLYIKYIDMKVEKRRASININKLILLQNKVKIRYVNNTNLLDYLYLKYDISSAEALDKLWNQYLREKDERIRMEEAMADLEFHQNELIKLLKRYHLEDPAIWLHQTDAILDPKEMVEVRHGLIVRRQQLRRQMEYNRELALLAQNEIKEVVDEYPKYAAEIMELVTEYEKMTSKK